MAIAAMERTMLGTVALAVPTDWIETKRDSERVTLRSSDENEQATLSILTLAKVPSFGEFERICEHRLAAERLELTDGFVNPTGPADNHGRFTLLYSGGDKANGRLFSCYLFAREATIVTIYLEAFGISPQHHLASFKAFVTGKPG